MGVFDRGRWYVDKRKILSLAVRVWIITTRTTTGEKRESVVIDTTDQDEPTFLKSQQERFGDWFIGAKLQTCVESS